MASLLIGKLEVAGCDIDHGRLIEDEAIAVDLVAEFLRNCTKGAQTCGNCVFEGLR